MTKLLHIVNQIRENKQRDPLDSINPDMKLRNDVGFDSLDLAELTVRIESEYGVDVFEEGIVETVGEILSKIDQHE